MVGATAAASVTALSPAAAKGHGKRLPKGLAKKAARKQVIAASGDLDFGDWEGATVGKPTTFYRKNTDKGSAFLPSAFVFPVRDGATNIGYVTTTARRTEGPIVEYSTATSPAEQLAQIRQTEATRGKSETVPLYHGGVKYGLGFADDTAVNVMNGRPTPLGDGIGKNALATETATDQWGTIRDTPITSTTGLTPNSSDDSVSTMASEDYVPYVPAWTETDNNDPWQKWDGCYPIAASMLIASHENAPRPENEDAKDRMIDRLHREMNTSNDGWTITKNAAQGVRSYDYGKHSYDPTIRGAYSKTKGDVRHQIFNNRPLLLEIHGGSRFQDHAITVVGYKNNADRLRIHNTWDSSAHWFSWGNWNAMNMISVDYY